MQTLKTAAIVVLLMTVMYGAYVSLTTPPEPLPADVQGMLVINDDETLAIDAGLPESLGELNFGAHPLSTEVAAETSEAPTFATIDSGTSFETPESADNSAPNDIVSTPDGIAARLSDTVPPGAMDIPQRTDVAKSTPYQSPTNYPTTSNTFELPDPSSVESSFGRGPNGSPDNSGLALAMGTSDSASQNPSSEVSPASAIGNVGLANAIQTADRQYAGDKRKDALATLSLFYDTPNLSGEQRSDLLARLDPLAREVIYSRSHLLEQPYRVGQNETLMEIAARFEVPWQLLANINQIDDPVTILPGTELKVVRGPFRAEVSLRQKELTLFLGDLYAGRFPVGIGNDPTPKPGTFTVQDKQTSKTFYDASGSPVPPGSPDNPYGEVWLDLGGQLSIHGSPSTTSPNAKGCISLAADYADDLYGILSQGSSVTIRR